MGSVGTKRALKGVIYNNGYWPFYSTVKVDLETGILKNRSYFCGIWTLRIGGSSADDPRIWILRIVRGFGFCGFFETRSSWPFSIYRLPITVRIWTLWGKQTLNSRVREMSVSVSLNLAHQRSLPLRSHGPLAKSQGSEFVKFSYLR